MGQRNHAAAPTANLADMSNGQPAMKVPGFREPKKQWVTVMNQAETGNERQRRMPLQDSNIAGKSAAGKRGAMPAKPALPPRDPVDASLHFQPAWPKHVNPLKREDNNNTLITK